MIYNIGVESDNEEHKKEWLEVKRTGSSGSDNRRSRLTGQSKKV